MLQTFSCISFLFKPPCLEKPEPSELTASIRHIVRLSKSRIPLYNSELLDTAGRKTRSRRRTQAIAKHYAFRKRNNIK